ncbi:MAG: PQQ-dependent sugar dehydrogenase [Herpetosiphonaceae bacterium]|nr:PQQ-dependent sugar dehydrogenase [Herpetosiphonaceae bacterium]
MALNLATLALLTLLIGTAGGGAWLIRRQRGGWRVVGIILVLEALILLAAQYLLSTFPIGIGEPLIRVPFIALLAQTLGILLAIGAVVALLLLIGRRIRYLIDQQLRRRWLIGGMLLLLPILAGASMVVMWKTSIPLRERERDPSKRDISLSEGFEWSIYAQGTIDNPTAIAFGPDGRLYIADIAGDLWVGTDTNSDFSIDTITRWAGGFDLLVGVVWHQDELFAASSGKIEALRDSDNDGVADQRRTVVDGLPSLILRPHSNNGLAIGPDGRLYFGVGSTTDGLTESEPLAASILSVNPDGSDLKVYARGIGNSFDVAFNQAGALFGGDNGPSRDPNSSEDPPDEFNFYAEDQHYGYPYFYGDPPKNGGTRSALVSFPAHSVPTGVTFYAGDTYPPDYRDSAFITLWQRGEIAHIEVGSTPSGDYLARSTTFGSGFLYPIDVITGPDGNLYVADFGTSAIYRITYGGAR